MDSRTDRHPPGAVRDAIISVLEKSDQALSMIEIELGVGKQLGPVARSSIRSYLNAQTPGVFERTARGCYRLNCESPATDAGFRKPEPVFTYGSAALYEGDCFRLLRAFEANSLQAAVTDPPYGLVEFSDEQLAKLRSRRGGVWRIPPSFDGSKRSPLPRFTVLGDAELRRLEEFFADFGRAVRRVLVPGANVVVASNVLVSQYAAAGLTRSGLESRGAVARLVMTMRGGDRPKNAHDEFPGVSVMPRSMWEPWLLFRRPLEGRVQDNLRKWGTGGFRRNSGTSPFGDVIASNPTRGKERDIAPHPALKPQDFLRKIVRASLPLGTGTVIDPFAGSGSTLAAALAVGYPAIGIEKDSGYIEVARGAIPRLAGL